MTLRRTELKRKTQLKSRSELKRTPFAKTPVATRKGTPAGEWRGGKATVGEWSPKSGGVARKPLRATSARVDAKRPARKQVVASVLARDGGVCRAARLVPQIACGGPLDCHEIIPRSAWRDGELVESNVIAVCRRHHDHIGDHPAEAHALGLHGFSWERPA